MLLRERIFAVILGASEWPHNPDFESSASFKNSAEALRLYLITQPGLEVPENNIKWLFDSVEAPYLVVKEIRGFLREAATSTPSGGIPDIIVYYVGHGGFASEGEYLLALRSAQKDDLGISSLPVRSLARVLKGFRQARFYVILDCCYAASAVTVFQSCTLPSANRVIRDVFPSRGTALLCASGAKLRAQAPENMTYTMFSSALLTLLKDGDPDGDAPALFSLADLEERLREYIDYNYDDGVLPEVHSPDKQSGDVAKMPIFPNPAKTMNDLEPKAMTALELAAGNKVGKTAEETGKAVQVIGWEGIEEDWLYRDIRKPDCLVGMSTIDTLPHLRFRRRSFDLVILDVEFMDRYYGELRRLQNIKNIHSIQFEQQWARMAPVVKQVAGRSLRKNGDQLGLPIQFGFMEVLVNRSVLPELASSGPASYTNINLNDIFDLCRQRGAKVGLWDWYLPTLLQLSLTVNNYSTLLERFRAKEVSLPQVIAEVHRGFRETTEADIAGVVKSIERNIDLVEFIDSGIRLTSELLGSGTGDDVGIVFGAGSSLLVDSDEESRRTLRGDVVALIPDDLLLTWINCCAILDGYDCSQNECAELIRYWLRKDTQVGLSNYQGYHGCPVTTEALLEIIPDTFHPAYGTLQRVIDESGRLREGMVVTTRALPRDWRGWQRLWETVKHKQPAAA